MRSVLRIGFLGMVCGAWALASVAVTPGAARAADKAMMDQPVALETVVVGTPARIEVFPATVKLTGVRQQMQLVVTGHYADGTLQDLTRASQFVSSNPAIAVLEGSVLKPKADGTCDVTISAGGQQTKVAVEVSNQGQPDPVMFETGALVALTKNGCNSGACHGSPGQWRCGRVAEARACKALHLGSIPSIASSSSYVVVPRESRGSMFRLIHHLARSSRQN